MAKVCKFQLEKQLVSYNCGETWQQTGVARKKNQPPVEVNSTDCGFMLIYRWADSVGDYECDGVKKYAVRVLQYTTEQEGEYQNVYPEYKRKVGDPIDFLSTDCGYEQSTGAFKFSGTSVVECGTKPVGFQDEYDFSTLYQSEVSGAVQSHSIVGDCTEIIGGYAFSGTAVETVDISEYTKEIGYGAFKDCYSITNITLPSSIEKVGGAVFQNCTSLSAATLPNGIEYIPNKAFTNTSITSFTVPNGVSVIGAGAFANYFPGDPSLSGQTGISISYPNTVTDLGGNVFYSRSGYTYPASMKSIGSVHDSTPLPNGLEHIGGFYLSRWDGSSTQFSGTIPGSVKCVSHGYGGWHLATGEKPIDITYSEGTEYIDHPFNQLPNSISIIETLPPCDSTGAIVIPSGTKVIIGRESGQTAVTNGRIVFEGSTPPIIAKYYSISVPVIVPDGSEELYRLWGYNNVYPQSSVTIDWVNEDINTRYECVGTDKHYSQYGVISYSGNTDYLRGCSGERIYRLGGVYETDSIDCGYIPTEYTAIFKYNDGKADSAITCDTSVVPYVDSDTTLASVDIGECARTMNAFVRCTSLSSITISNGLTSIGNSAFYGCTGLTSITIPNSVTSIGERAFYHCDSLSSITIPNSVTSSIDDEAFSYCSSLSSITIGNGVTSIGNYAFNSCTSLSSITIPNSVTSIGDYAFYGCSSLSSVTISNGLTSIGGNAFNSCTSLSSITIPNSVTSIGERAFQNCAGLTGDIVIPSGVTRIERTTFYGCGSLTSVVLPSSVTRIGIEAFQYCTGLTSITIDRATPPTLPSLNYLTIFNNTNNCPIYVPAESVNTYKTTTRWSSYASRIQPIP